MKILLLSLADEPFWPIADISNPNKFEYCELHGYDFASSIDLAEIVEELMDEVDNLDPVDHQW